MALDKLLGRYDADEQAFVRQVKQSRNRRAVSKMKDVYPDLDFLPSEELMDSYLSNSLERLFGNTVPDD